MLQFVKSKCFNFKCLVGFVLLALGIGFGIPFLFESLLNAGLVKSQADFVKGLLYVGVLLMMLINWFVCLSALLSVPYLNAGSYSSMSSNAKDDAKLVFSAMKKSLLWLGFGALFWIGIWLAQASDLMI